LERSCARRSDDTDAWNSADAFLDFESLLEPRTAVAVEKPADDHSIPADAVLMPPEVADDLDDDLAWFEGGIRSPPGPGEGAARSPPRGGMPPAGDRC